MNKKELKRLVDEKHTYSICGGKETVDKKTGKTKVSRYHTRLDNGTQVYASRKDDLYRKLFEYYYGNSGNTLESLFEPYLEWKKKRLNLVAGTIKRERNIFKKHILGTKIAKKQITDIRASDIEEFFSSYSERIKRKELTAIKSVVNNIFDYAIANNIVHNNYARQYNTRTIKTVAETSRYNVFTDVDREKILGALEGSTNIYDLSIVFMFCLCCRIGELRAMKWDDILGDDERILIRSEIVLRDDGTGRGRNKYVEVSHTKTGHDSGVRALPLNPRAKNVLSTVRRVYGAKGTYIFTGKSGTFLYETPFGKHLKDACEKAGVTYRSSHKIRFWAASSLASQGASIQELMAIGGWADSSTALGYIRMNDSGEKAKRLFDSAIK